MKILCLPLGPVKANCYVVVDEDSGLAALVDPGEYNEELKSLLKDEGIRDLKYILLTHGHYDHLLGVSDVKADFPGANVVIHPYDSPCLVCEDISFATHVDKGIQKYIDYDMLVEDGDEFSLGSLRFRVMHTPGHTPGGVCYIENTQRIIFSGDVLFCRTVGRTDLPGGNWENLVKSLKKLAGLEGDYTVYTGHNRSTTLAVERVKNRYLSRLLRQETEGKSV